MMTVGCRRLCQLPGFDYHRAVMRNPLAREFLLGIWKIHILFHAASEDGVYGHWMLEELAHHGHRLSPGTLYPIFSRMVKRGWLRVTPADGRQQRVYRLTPAGKVVLEQLRAAVEELHHEIAPPVAARRRSETKATARASRHSHRKDVR